MAAVASILTLVGILLASIPSVRERIGWTGRGEASYSIGSRADIPGEILRSPGRTIIFFSRTSCSACERSKTIFSEIVSDARALGSVNVRFVAPDALVEEEQTFARSVGLREPEIFVVPFGGLRLKHVPTTIVVDETGQVVFSREGVLGEANRGELGKFLNLATN